MTLALEWIDEREYSDEEAESGWPQLLERLLQIAGQAEGVEEGVVTVTLTDDEGIRELNKEYRGLDKPTDVLSFPLRGGEEPNIHYDDDFETLEGGNPEDVGGDPFAELLGDIVISVPRMHAQADDYGHSAERELGFLFVHGFLHLLGYDHESEEQEKDMFAKQEAVLSKAGLTR
ncbi:rRNA maturation RNase YbeY [Cohnella lubricantis]|uniref:Endoribonuclease YbeY n=1 Tax=Cohnella lubricantis TaxID=2163172 RepID=A0A841TJS4_9BACL|nr:rRNA maturation RNase YbeY [Cohnella lubricantis]MBB6678741.1 rRNA maturation RNase YbeY [Cohnella lubricantis]MBP2119809.1 putative rRNA maturation factor [Cohnella lubricantis]